MRIIKSLIFFSFLLIPSTGQGQGNNINNRFFTTFATESITVAGTAIGFTVATINPVGSPFRANRAMFVVECAASSPCPIRILTTGAAPTSSVGLLSNAGDIVTIYGFDDISNFKAIRTTANSATIQPLYSR